GYVAGFGKVLSSASDDCPCGGHLIGHGRRWRWVVSLEGYSEARIRYVTTQQEHHDSGEVTLKVSAFLDSPLDSKGGAAGKLGVTLPPPRGRQRRPSRRLARRRAQARGEPLRLRDPDREARALVARRLRRAEAV
ncbi:MAG: hypothetical protein ACYTKD_02060, partial [Planctomycetota bacterium]